MVSILQKYEEIYNVKITFSVETEPLGTGKLFSFFVFVSGLFLRLSFLVYCSRSFSIPLGGLICEERTLQGCRMKGREPKSEEGHSSMHCLLSI